MDDAPTPELLNANAAADPLLVALGGALDGSQPLDPIAMLKAHLGAQANPRASMLLRILEQRQQQQARALELQRQEAALNEDEDAAAAEASVDMQEDMRNVQQAVDALYGELALLRARSQALAAATGACPICFGENPMCGECGGLGVPGSRRPEPRAFRKYVRPALARARAIEYGRAGGMASDAPLVPATSG